VRLATGVEVSCKRIRSARETAGKLTTLDVGRLSPRRPGLVAELDTGRGVSRPSVESSYRGGEAGGELIGKGD
jgi:hypothetical protein